MKYPTPKDRFNIEDFNGNFRELDKRVTDQSDYNNLKNKPFGEEYGIYFEGETDINTEGTELTSPYSPEEGAIVNVTFDLVEYECKVFDFYGVMTIGNVGIYGMESETDEPFLILFTGNTAGVIVADNTVQHTIKVAGEQLHKINPKFFETKNTLYLGQADNYLHKGVAESETNRVTRDELLQAVKTQPILLSEGDTCYYSPTIILPYASENHGEIRIVVQNAVNNSATWKTYYTAEYTP